MDGDIHFVTSGDLNLATHPYILATRTLRPMTRLTQACAWIDSKVCRRTTRVAEPRVCLPPSVSDVAFDMIRHRAEPPQIRGESVPK